MWGPSVAGAPLIPAVFRGAALGALMAGAGLLLFLATADPDAAQIADRRIRALVTGLTLAAAVLLAAHALAWIVNTSPEPSTARISVDGAPARGRIVDLTGAPLADVDTELPLRAWEIATLELDA